MLEKTDWNAIKSEIYKSIYSPSVFEEALGLPFDLKKRYINPFRPSKSADSGFFEDKDYKGVYYFYDFVEGKRYDIFEVVQQSYRFTFIEGISWLANTYSLWDKLSVLGFKKEASSSKLKGPPNAYFNMLKAQKIEELRLKREAEFEKAWPTEYRYGWDNIYPHIFHCQGYQIKTMHLNNDEHEDFWYRRGMLIPDNCLCVEEFISESGKTIFRDSPGNPMFFFIGEGESGQIYRPFADKRTKFRNLGPAEFRWENGGTHEYTIVSKGFKDFNLLKAMGFGVAGKCGESSRVDPLEQMLYTNKFLVVLMDNDEAGIKAAKLQVAHFNRFGIKAISITMPKPAGKDVDDVVCMYGLRATKKLIKFLIKKEIRNDRTRKRT